MGNRWISRRKGDSATSPRTFLHPPISSAPHCTAQWFGEYETPESDFSRFFLVPPKGTERTGIPGLCLLCLLWLKQTILRASASPRDSFFFTCSEIRKWGCGLVASRKFPDNSRFRLNRPPRRFRLRVDVEQVVCKERESYTTGRNLEVPKIAVVIEKREDN